MPWLPQYSNPGQLSIPQAMIPTLIGCGSIDAYRRAEAYRSAAPLPLNLQLEIDRRVGQVGLERLAIVRSIIDRNFTLPIPNWLARTELYWEYESKHGGAIETMTPQAQDFNQKPDRKSARVPIYCTIDGFNMTIREYQQFQETGTFDSSNVSQAVRRVNERVEYTFINGSDLVSGGYSVPGLLNAPNANTVEYKSNVAWDDPSKTGADIFTDVEGLIAQQEANQKFGPHELWVNTTYNRVLDNDFKALSNLSIRQRLQQIDNGAGGPLTIQVADRIPKDYVILLQATDDVISAGLGQEPTVISWSDGPGFNFFFLVIACCVPQFKSSYTNQSGITIGYPNF